MQYHRCFVIGLVAMLFCACQVVVSGQGLVYAWGYDVDGELGQGTVTGGTFEPLQVTGLTGVAAISAGAFHNIALKKDGTVWTWGLNNHGPVPTQMTTLSGMTAISGGGFHSLALKNDGTVWAWGLNASGQLGDGAYGPFVDIPVQVSGLTGVIAIAAGGYHSLALKSDGTVWAWGTGALGTLGNGTFGINVALPVQVSGLTSVTAISAGFYHSMALKSDGTAWAWGYNGFGQLGDGSFLNASVPVQISALTGVKEIAGGGHHSLAVKSDGTAWAWGEDLSGQLGLGIFGFPINTPTQVSVLSGTSGVAAGGQFSLAVKNDGTAWAWGDNRSGQTANPIFIPPLTVILQIDTPTRVDRLVHITEVAAGMDHGLALYAPTPQQLIGDLMERLALVAIVDNLSKGETNSLTVKLEAALASSQAGDTASAVDEMTAFINEVDAMVKSGRLTGGDAAALIPAAKTIISLL
jgi:alpha-tubulin suppressor-like RCC1 family protein